MIWILLGVISFGLLVGAVSGLSSKSVASTLLKVLFAFAGGSLVGVVTGLSASQMVLIGKCLTAFCLSTLSGLMLGVIVRVRSKKAGITVMPYTVPNEEEARVEEAMTEAFARVSEQLDKGEVKPEEILADFFPVYRVTDECLAKLGDAHVPTPVLNRLSHLKEEEQAFNGDEFGKKLDSLLTEDERTKFKIEIVNKAKSLDRDSLSREALETVLNEFLAPHRGYKYAPASKRALVDACRIAFEYLHREESDGGGAPECITNGST